MSPVHTGPSKDSPTRQGLLAGIVDAVRTHPGIANKSAIGLVTEVLGRTDWLTGPGDDGAVVDALGSTVVACGEALLPEFVATDPYGAGVAAVLTNVNDLAAMGALPLGIVDTIVANEQVARTVLEGMRHACELYDVPILGGHLTPHTGSPSVSAFGVGVTAQALTITRVSPGQRLMLACAVDGEMRTDFPFFRSFEARGKRCAGDVRVLASVAESGACVAAKDVSMAGLVGSLAMLLEWGGHGATVDLDALPTPEGVSLSAWLTCFPSFAFLLCVPAGREEDCAAPFRDRGLVASVIGEIDDSGTVSLRLGDQTETVMAVTDSPVTRLDRTSPDLSPDAPQTTGGAP
ncbi:AIR synthase related protein [Streptomyces sp. NPDC005393]|uniref:AIR synthase related protein n=1 Tax=Streptomyces sp. NPDC005393 TaxID=3157041 RepID=UPI0033B1F377